MLCRKRTEMTGEHDELMRQEQPTVIGHVTLRAARAAHSFGQLELEICLKSRKVRGYSAFTELPTQKDFFLQRK